MREVRIRFSKTDRAKYISHLDLTRCFARAIARAEIPLWFTEGFNPRPYMTFTSPLTLGAESVAEALDIRLEDDTMTDEEIVSRLSAVMPLDIRILSAAPPVHKLREIEESRYRLEIEPSSGDATALAERFEAISRKSPLPVEKPGKQGKKKVVKTIDLAEYTKDFSVTAEADGMVVMQVTLPSSNQFGVNPRLFLDKYLQEVGEEPIRIRMIREALYCTDGVLFE